ncbi:MAG: SDR family oxidoreductase [Rhodobacteraceae bacterium]|nr:MAG: SDR family oxidoreductase [Paracoccaceae bacterium]
MTRVVFRSTHPDSLILQVDLAQVNAPALIAEEPPLPEFDMARAQHILNVNTLAPMVILGAALPHLAPGASVVNITSINARFPPVGAPVYGASKAALENLTIACAKTLGPRGIRVNAVSPGAVERAHAPRPPDLIRHFTDGSALGRLALQDEIASAVRFLLSSAASGITGTVLEVSAGYRL